MRRREFITLLSGAAGPWPRVARAQPPGKVPVVGVLHGGKRELFLRAVDDFEQGLADAGFVVGQNVAIEYRWANLRYSQVPALVQELVGRQVSVIFAADSPTPARAAKAATTTIPIVFIYGGDPVRDGLVASLARPGGNLTGLTGLKSELFGKQLGLLHEMVPHAKTIGLLTGRTSDARSLEIRGEILAAAQTLGLDMVVVEVASSQFERPFATLADRQAGAVLITNNTLFINYPRIIIGLAARHGIPAMYPGPYFARLGGLIGYGTPVGPAYRQAAAQYVAPILKGTKPADLPVQQPTKFELVINLRTAKALGLEVPIALHTIADEVIE